MIVTEGEMMMTDYIKRADAIDACCRGWNNTAEDCIRNIKALPSAELPKGELISRADAIERIVNDNVVGGMDRINEYRNSNEHNDYLDGISCAIATVDDVPSAETHEIRTETHGVCLISKDDAMGAVQDHFNADGFKGYDDGQKMMDRIKAIPSAEAEQVTGKLKEHCDSLLKSDSDECKEQKSKLDLIRREDAINAIDDAIDTDSPQWAILRTKIGFLPSADAEFADMPDIPRYYYEKVVGNMAHEINMLKEQLESAEAVQGEWKQEYRKTANGVDFCVIACSECDYYDAQMYYYNYCPNCGARMKGGGE